MSVVKRGVPSEVLDYVTLVTAPFRGRLAYDKVGNDFLVLSVTWAISLQCD